MAKPENQFIDSVHRHLPPDLHHEGMANPYRGGTADCWYSGRKADLWIEWKFLVVPKRDDTVISLIKGKDPMLSHLQQKWLRDRYTEGRRVWVIVGSKDGGMAFHHLNWENDFTAGYFRRWMVSRKELAEQIRIAVA